MSKFRPRMYYRDIFHINYDLLKKKNIKLLIFDVDNTTVKIDEKLPNAKVKNLIEKLKKDFIVTMASNNKIKRVKDVGKYLGIHAFYSVGKPSKKIKKLLLRKFDILMEEVAIIGDQIVTDILMGNRLGMLTILVDPIENKDLKVTYFNRWLEKIILKKIKLNKGNYYEN